MPSRESLRIRLRLMHRWEAIAERLTHNDESALAEAIDILEGIRLNATCESMTWVFRGLVSALDQMQPQIDAGGWKM